MIIYKMYFKVIKKNLLLILSTLLISIAIAYVQSSSSNTNLSIEFTNEKIGLVNTSKINKNAGLIEYVNEKFDVTNLKDDEKKIKDALFYQKVVYVLVINEDSYDRYALNDLAKASYIDNLINRYISTKQIYTDFQVDPSRINSLVKDDLSKTVKLVDVTKKTSDVTHNVARYFNFYVYGLFGAILSGVCLVMLAFNNSSVYKRSVLSAMPMKTRNKHLFISHFILSLAMWSLATIYGLVIYKGQYDSTIIMYIVNSLVFLLVISSIAFLVGTSITKASQMPPINNLITLGASFLSGAFVPLSLMSDSILNFSKLLPTYWYVLSNDKIATLETVDFTTIYNPMLIQLLFTFAIFGIGLVISKNKMQNK